LASSADDLLQQDIEVLAERLLARLNLRIALVALTGLLFLVAWNRGIALLYGLFALLLATVVVAYLAPRYNLYGIFARRHHPPRAHEGDKVEVEVVLANRWPVARYMLEVVDWMPFAAEAEQRPMSFVPSLRRSQRLRLAVRCDCRGVHSVGPLRLQSAYPLGVHRAEREVPDSTSEILVYPAIFPIARLSLLGTSHLPTVGAMRARRVGGNDEFVGVREYRRGDPPRHIHWSASARHGALVVREHESLHRPEVCILLDLHRAANCGVGKHSTLEYAVKIAASIAAFALDEGHEVRLVGLGAAPLDLPLGRGGRQLERVLEALARVQADGDVPYPAAIARVVQRIAHGSLLVLFNAGGAGEIETGALHRRHVHPLWIHFDRRSFERPGGPNGPVSPPAPVQGYWVRRGDDLARVFAR